uniref:ATP-dependent RNA helicase n=1 Tax=Plectus sambesii TaxID=2011161 RepID=A0A914X8R4_9BILA
MNQVKRVAVYEEFCRKQHAALFATDVAARGLDFPAVDWVVQLDCPCDVDEYIHRSGRTARYGSKGEALLILTPSQEPAMVAKLQKRNIPIQKISVDPKRMTDIRKKLESELVQYTGLKDFAQKSFIAYLRSIFLMKQKDVFDVNSIDLEALARSYGLAIAPRVRFMRKHASKNGTAQPKVERKEKDIDELTSMLFSSAKARKGAAPPQPVDESDDDDDGLAGDEDDDEDEDEDGESASGDDDQPSDNEEGRSSGGSDDGNDSDEDLLTVRRSDVFNVLPTSHDPSQSNQAPEEQSSKQNDDQLDDPPPGPRSSQKRQKPLTKATVVKQLLRKKKVVNKKTVFGEDDDDGTSRKLEEADEFEKGLDIKKAIDDMKAADKVDRETFRERRKALRLEKKRKEKEQVEERRRKRRKVDDEVVDARLPGASDSEGESVDLSWLPDPDRPLRLNDDDDDEDAEHIAPQKLRADEDLALALLSAKKK